MFTGLRFCGDRLPDAIAVSGNEQRPGRIALLKTEIPVPRIAAADIEFPEISVQVARINCIDNTVAVGIDSDGCRQAVRVLPALPTPVFKDLMSAPVSRSTIYNTA